MFALTDKEKKSQKDKVSYIMCLKSQDQNPGLLPFGAFISLWPSPASSVIRFCSSHKTGVLTSQRSLNHESQLLSWDY